MFDAERLRILEGDLPYSLWKYYILCIHVNNKYLVIIGLKIQTF